MTSRSLFAYGTPRDPDVLALVLGRRPARASVSEATAPGYRAVFLPGRTYPGLRREAGASAEGLSLRDLSGTDFVVFDCLEGEEYSRAPMEVVVEARGLQPAPTGLG